MTDDNAYQRGMQAERVLWDLRMSILADRFEAHDPHLAALLRAEIADIIKMDACDNCGCTRADHGAAGLLNGCRAFVEKALP